MQSLVCDPCFSFVSKAFLITCASLDVRGSCGWPPYAPPIRPPPPSETPLVRACLLLPRSFPAASYAHRILQESSVHVWQSNLGLKTGLSPQRLPTRLSHVNSLHSSSHSPQFSKMKMRPERQLLRRPPILFFERLLSSCSGASDVFRQCSRQPSLSFPPRRAWRIGSVAAFSRSPHTYRCRRPLFSGSAYLLRPRVNHPTSLFPSPRTTINFHSPAARSRDKSNPFNFSMPCQHLFSQFMVYKAEKRKDSDRCACPL